MYPMMPPMGGMNGMAPSPFMGQQQRPQAPGMQAPGMQRMQSPATRPMPRPQFGGGMQGGMGGGMKRPSPQPMDVYMQNINPPLRTGGGQMGGGRPAGGNQPNWWGGDLMRGMFGESTGDYARRINNMGDIAG